MSYQPTISPSMFSDPTLSAGLLNDFGEGELTQKPLVFDVAWEVARKVGGIYTVLTSKAEITVKEFGDRYALIGPYLPNTNIAEFEELEPSAFSETVIDKLKTDYGINVKFGRWLVKGYPRVFLLDVESSRHRLGEWRNELHGSFQKPEDEETNNAIIFGYQVAYFLQVCRGFSLENRPILAHFHEWLVGVGLIVSKRWNVHVATIFTTHATILGRYLAAAGVDLYNVIHNVNPDEEAGNRQIYQRHWIEVGATRGCDIFTTVSEITGIEAKYLLGRDPNIITPNGLNIDNFTALHEFQNLHQKYKLKIHEFVRGHFYGIGNNFNLNKTLYFFTAGRREYTNKGVDLFIESLKSLNEMLKRDGSDITVVAFIIMPGDTNNYNVDSIKGQSVRREIRETCDDVIKQISQRMFEKVMSGNMPTGSDLLSHSDTVDLKRRVQTIQGHSSLPPIVTHNMNNPGGDEILNHLRAADLINKPEDRVKVVYHPEFLSATSPIFSIDYDQFIRGCHMGIFASYYEPWGYTPAECTVMGVPSITSNLAGFGSFMRSNIVNPESHGLFVVDRRNREFNETKEQMANIMFQFCSLNRRQRIRQRNKTERLSRLLSWKVLAEQYSIARKKAFKKYYGFHHDIPDIFDKKEADYDMM
eukprot:TRINITY_DN1269_c0_g1_i2.p1 TRINITY_DN1269_c0_g1~~TRINITY_DN1269_c0_g1_i2.p1  ORF type:complete len:658 (+),score=129.60 TRINITY_DN1269_c0_g1_i2:44-1975(+)